MVKITKTNPQEIKEFYKKEWVKADVKHYGKKVDWTQKGFYFKATDEGKIVGTLKMRIKAGVAYIQRVIVAKKARRRGIGKMLMQKAESIAIKNHAHKIELITGKGWEAKSFYRALGYRKVARLPKHYFKIDFLIFTKIL